MIPPPAAGVNSRKLQSELLPLTAPGFHFLHIYRRRRRPRRAEPRRLVVDPPAHHSADGDALLERERELRGRDEQQRGDRGTFNARDSHIPSTQTNVTLATALQ